MKVLTFPWRRLSPAKAAVESSMPVKTDWAGVDASTRSTTDSDSRSRDGLLIEQAFRSADEKLKLLLAEAKGQKRKIKK